jgi:hypothetical protein
MFGAQGEIRTHEIVRFAGAAIEPLWYLGIILVRLPGIEPGLQV